MARRPRFPTALPRPRLLGHQVPCLVLVAPAGGGKTVLAAQFADTVPGSTRVVWLRPSTPGTSAGALVAAARTSLGAEPAGPAADPAVHAEALLAAAAGDPMLLVVDDADRADAADLARWLAETVPLLDSGSAVLVCARDRPAGLLGRLGTAARLVDAAMLAFTVAEVGALLERTGADPDEAETLHTATGGWPAAVAAAAAKGGPLGAVGTGQALAEALGVAVADDPGCRAALDLLALAGAIPAEVLDRLVSDAAARRLAERTPLVQTESGRLRLADPARAAWLAGTRVAPATVAALADALAGADPATAVDLLLDCGRPDRAADVLAEAVGRLPVSWVRPRLYRLPAQLRRSLPPALSAVAATVDLDSAIAHAERALAMAVTPAAQAAARFALGSALAHSGDLDNAAAELAAARRGATDPRMAQAVDSWLGLVRLWLGDVIGAEAAVSGGPRTVLACWVRCECALERGNLREARAAAQDAQELAGADLGPAVGDALLAKVAVYEAGRPDPAAPAAATAERAYRAATGRGGLELLAAAGVHAWFLLAAGRVGEAVSVADALRRTVGRQDAASRLQAALLRLAAAGLAADDAAAGRAAAEASTLRRLGFALLEAQARRFTPGLVGSERGLRVRLMGAAEIEVNGRILPANAWRSRKAREALLALAAAGPRGLRREELVERLWPGREPGRGRTLLRTALAELRRVLEPERPPGEPSAYLRADRDRVHVRAEVDVADAREHVLAGRFEQALALLGADVAAGEPDLAALADVRAEADELRLRAAGRITGDAGRPVEQRAAAYESVLAAQPWRHDLAEELVALWWRAGDATRARAADRHYLGRG
ncbi:MAG TPA: hypothetical protein VFV67_11350 [Actinophytocola sp.]|uniref:hypothetical protein n=1 Tax=Actinophytocola sp. TaxID=1872138 RepID=UPI002DBC814B|nr:hypothetical protein [Actinophytocola sp.]HEU5471240.1 hypothetical protein [Actinophytocola sp.]